MGKKVAIGALICIGLGAFFSLWTSSISLGELLKQPLQSLWGSHQNLQSGVLEVSESFESVEEATRRLLKPFGMVRLTRRFPPVAPSETSSNPHQ